MAGRSYNVSFNITGAMDGSLLAALRNAANAMRGLGDSARAASNAAKASKAGLQGLANSLNTIQSAANKFRDLKRATLESQQALSAAQNNANQLATKYRQDAQAAEILRQKLSQLNTELGKAQNSKVGEKANLNALKNQLRELKAAFTEAKKLGDTAKMSSLSSAMAATNSAIQAQQAKLRAASQAYTELADRIKQTKAELKSAETAASQSGRGFESAKTQAASLKASLQQQLATLQQLRTQLGSAGFSTSSFVSSERQLQAEIERVNAAIQRQQALLQARQNFNSSATNLAISGAGMMGAMYTAEQMAAPFKTAIEKATEFERVMSEVKALTQMDNLKVGNYEAVEREMKALSSQAKELGATTIYTAQEVGEAQAYIARTGWATDQILGATPIFLKLAASQHMDIARTADLATNIMTAFGHNMAAVGNDADKFAQMIQHDADVFAYTVTHSNQTFEQFGEAMKYAAPVAKNFGATIEEASMMTKFMGDAGIQGSMAGTSMRQTMLRLISPPKRATKAMEQYGITLDDANAAWQNANAVAQEYGVTLEENLSPGRQFINVMKQIDKNMAGASDREKLAALSAITGINAVSGAANLFGAGAEQAKNFTELLEQCDGALEQTYQVMTDNTFGAQKSFESAWEAVQPSVGEALLGIAKYGYETFAPILTSLSQFIDANPQVVQAAAGIAGAFATIVVGAAAVKLAFAGWAFITSTISLVSTALSSLGSGALLGGLIGRIAAVRTALFGLGGAATFGGWSAMFGAISAQAAMAATAIKTFFASLTLGSMSSGIVSTITAIGTALRGAAIAAMSFAFSPIGVALMALALAGMYCYQNWEKVAPVLSNIANIITGSLSGALQTIAPAIQNVMQAFDNLGSALGTSGLLSQLGMLVTGALATIATAIAGTLATIINVAATIVSTIANIISGIVNLISNIISGNWSAAWENAKSIATSALEGIGNVAKGILDGIATTVESIGKAWSFLKGDIPSVHGEEHGGSGGSFGESQPQVQTPAPIMQTVPEVLAQIPTVSETLQLDTSQAQAGLDALGASSEQAAMSTAQIQTATDALAQFPASVQPTTEAFAQIPAAVQPAAMSLQTLGTSTQTLDASLMTAGTNVQTFGTNAQSAGTNVQALATSAQSAATSADALSTSASGATSGIDALSASAAGATGGVDALGSAASGAAGAVSGLGAAAQSACAQLAAAGANAAAAVSSAVATASAGKPAANYEGGIYRKGAFLTTFAEKSPEAAIPLDNSSRAENLWRQTGQMLGLLPKTENIPFEPTITTPPFNPNINLPKPTEIPSRTSKRQRSQRIPEIFTRTTQTIPRYYDIFGGGLAGDLLNRIISPQIMLPNQREESGGIFDGLREKIFSSPAETQSPVFNVTINVNISGNANREEVRRGVEESLPTVEKSFAQQWQAFSRERARRSFA